MHIEKRSQKRKQQVFFSVCSKGQKARFEFNQTAKLANLSEQRDKVRSISAPAASLHNSCCISTLKYGMQRNALGSGHMRPNIQRWNTTHCLSALPPWRLLAGYLHASCAISLFRDPTADFELQSAAQRFLPGAAQAKLGNKKVSPARPSANE